MRESFKWWMVMVLALGVGQRVVEAQAPPAKAAPAKAGKGDKAEEPKEPEEPKINVYAEMAKANKLANAGAYSRAVPVYERVLEADPDNYAIAHFNLGEIYKIRNKCKPAAFHYQAYLMTGRDEETLKHARAGLRQCLQPTSATLAVRIAQPEGEVYINGFLFKRGELTPLQLPAGEYKIEARAIDHATQARTIKLKDQEPQQIEMSLERFTFFGLLKVEVDKPGALVRISPLALDKPDETAQPMQVGAPMAAPVKLATGKYFIEIEREGYMPWIRNVQVTREGTTLVEARLTQQLPEEIR
jgi:hypothetical protein